MHGISRKLEKIVWITLFLASLGGSIALNLIPAAPDLPQIDPRQEMGWIEIAIFDGQQLSHLQPVGFGEPENPDASPGLLVTLLEKFPAWLAMQAVILTVALVLFLAKRPAAIKATHRLNLTFGFLALTWINLALAAARFGIAQADPLPAGFTRIGSQPGAVSPSSPETLAVLALGFGFSIGLSYLWIRWSRANRPEEVFL